MHYNTQPNVTNNEKLKYNRKSIIKLFLSSKISEFSQFQIYFYNIQIKLKLRNNGLTRNKVEISIERGRQRGTKAKSKLVEKRDSLTNLSTRSVAECGG